MSSVPARAWLGVPALVALIWLLGWWLVSLASVMPWYLEVVGLVGLVGIRNRVRYGRQIPRVRRSRRSSLM